MCSSLAAFHVQAVLHPRSVYLAPGVWAGVAQLDGFASGGGAELLSTAAAKDEVAERIRFFAEGSDSLQARQH